MGYIVVNFFASQTFEALAHSNPDLIISNQYFQQQLKSPKISIRSMVGQGMSLMEELVVLKSRSMMELSTSNNEITLRVVGKVIYLVITKSIPIAVKIVSDELGGCFSLLQLS